MQEDVANHITDMDSVHQRVSILRQQRHKSSNTSVSRSPSTLICVLYERHIVQALRIFQLTMYLNTTSKQTNVFVTNANKYENYSGT